MMTMNEDRPSDRAVSLKTVALSALLGLIVLLSIGAIAGAVAEWFKSPANWGEATLAIAGAVAVGGFATLGLLLLKPWGRSGEPISPKTRKANKLLLLSGLVGGVLGAVLAVSTISMDAPFAMFSNSPLPPTIAVVAAAGWLIAIGLSLQWHRSVDEHEAKAYEFGGLAALYVYGLLAPAWWLAWRGGLIPAPDTMVIFLVVTSVWGVGWFWRRYR